MSVQKQTRRIPVRSIEPHADARSGDRRVPQYVALLKAGKKAPPIWVVKQRGKYPYRVFDGAHRLEAAKRAGRKTIEAIVYDEQPVPDKNIEWQLAFFGNVRP